MSKKVTNFKDFQNGIKSGALSNLVDADLDLDNDVQDDNDKGERPLDLNAFLNNKKDGPGKALEDDVSTDSEMDDEIREVILSNKKLNGDELAALNERLYNWLVKRAEKVLKRKGRSYDQLTASYYERKAKDNEFIDLEQAKPLGASGKFCEVVELSADTSWRATMRLHGPAFRRRREKYLKNRPPKVVYKVSEQEEKRVQDEKETIDRWNLFVKNEKLLARGFEPERRETRAERLQREAREKEEQLVRWRQMGEYAKARLPVHELEQRASLLDWDYGIYHLWDIMKNPVPGVGYVPELESASKGIMKVESDYQKHALVNIHEGSLFHKVTGQVEASYQEYYLNRKLEEAELFILEEKIRVAELALAEEKERNRLPDGPDRIVRSTGPVKLTKHQKKMREALFQKAVDRQIWRGKGTSKEVAQKIYKDLRRLEASQTGNAQLSFIEASGDGVGNFDSLTCPGCAAPNVSCVSLGRSIRNRTRTIRRLWGRIQSRIAPRNDKRKKRKRRPKTSAVSPGSELVKLRDANVIQEQLPEDIALHHMDERTNSAYEMTYPENNNGVVSEGGHEKEEVSSAEHNDDENRQVIVLEQGDSSTVEKAQHSLTGRPNESSGDDGELGTHTLLEVQPGLVNHETTECKSGDVEEINTEVEKQDIDPKSPSRLNRITQHFSPAKFMQMRKGNMGGTKRTALPPIVNPPVTPQLPSLKQAEPSSTSRNEEGTEIEDIEKIRKEAQEVMAASQKTVLSRGERINKKLTKEEAVELIQELAKKRGERQLKSALGRQQGLSAVAVVEKDQSGGVDLDEARALRLEKMRRKQIFALDSKNKSKVEEVKYLELEKSRQQLQNKQEENEEVKELDREGEKEDAEDAIVSTKPVSFFEKYKASQKNKYSVKTKYSRKIRDDWSNKFKVDKQALDIASSDRPSWMNMDKDKKLITAIIKSHHQYIKVRDEQKQRCLECCCCCTCMCCVTADDLPDQYEDRRYNVADLMQAVMDQDIYLLLDILYHPNYPMAVDSLDINGESAFYRIMTDTMQNAFDKIVEDDGDAVIFKPSPFYVPKQLQKKAKKMRGKKEWVIKILLYAGADVNFISHTKAFEAGSLLHVAVEKNLRHYVEWLVENRNIEVNSYTTMLKRTPLMLACLKGLGDLVLYLLQHGAMSVLNYQDTRGWSALHFAAGFCDPITLKALLIAGADKFARNKKGRVPVDEALCRGQQENANILLTHNAFDPIKEHIDRMSHLKKYHESDINEAMKDARYRALNNSYKR